MEISAFPSICLFQPPSERPNPAPLKPLQPSGSRGVFHPCLLSFLCRNLEVDFDYLLSALGMVTVTMANDVPNWAGSLHSSLTMNHLGDPKSSGFDGPELCRHSQPCRSKGSCSQLLCPVWIGLLQSFEVPWVSPGAGASVTLGGLPEEQHMVVWSWSCSSKSSWVWDELWGCHRAGEDRALRAGMRLKVPPTQTSLEFSEPPNQGLSPRGHLPSAASTAEDVQTSPDFVINCCLTGISCGWPVLQTPNALCPPVCLCPIWVFSSCAV